MYPRRFGETVGQVDFGKINLTNSLAMWFIKSINIITIDITKHFDKSCWEQKQLLKLRWAKRISQSMALFRRINAPVSIVCHWPLTTTSFFIWKIKLLKEVLIEQGTEIGWWISTLKCGHVCAPSIMWYIPTWTHPSTTYREVAPNNTAFIILRQTRQHFTYWPLARSATTRFLSLFKHHMFSPFPREQFLSQRKIPLPSKMWQPTKSNE